MASSAKSVKREERKLVCFWVLTKTCFSGAASASNVVASSTSVSCRALDCS